MTLTARPFSGSTFFSDVRAAMNTNRGMFAGSDGAFRYVCLDASFYRLEILRRPGDRRFTETATTLPPDVRVVANGQLFRPYCWIPRPCADPIWEGEIIVAHTTHPGDPRSQAAHRHVGQWDGRGAMAFTMNTRGDPSTVTSPGTYNHALGSLIPLVQNRVPFGPTEVRDPTGKVTQLASPGGV